MKVEKSVAGTLSWTHQGDFVRGGRDSHYTYLNSNKTEVEISDASAEQAGNYDVLLKEGGCEMRKVIEVQVEGSYFFFCFWPYTIAA